MAFTNNAMENADRAKSFFEQFILFNEIIILHHERKVRLGKKF